ncbi:MAG TPA: ImuA protein [Beijerinckiaceae bacterium]|jgi:protein ImuA
MSPSIGEPAADRAAVVAQLRRLLPAEARTGAASLPFGVPAIDTHLPGGGLARGALHEVTAAEAAAVPAAFGFVAALMGHALRAQEQAQPLSSPASRSEAEARKGDPCPGGVLGPLPGRLRRPPGTTVVSQRSPESREALLVLSRGAAGFGRPYGHGLVALGLSPGRLLLVEAESDVQVLWAVEEALRLRAVAAVAGWIGQKLDLKASRRLQAAAEGSGALLLVLRPPQAEEANAAATRWRVGAAPAARDRFGCMERWRWSLSLERCRNGRPGAWVVELSDAHRFGLARPLAGPAVPESAELDLRRAG